MMDMNDYNNNSTDEGIFKGCEINERTTGSFNRHLRPLGRKKL